MPKPPKIKSFTDEITKIPLNQTVRVFERNKVFHRIDGPAVEWFNGEKDYYVDDKWYGSYPILVADASE